MHTNLKVAMVDQKATGESKLKCTMHIFYNNNHKIEFPNTRVFCTLHTKHGQHVWYKVGTSSKEMRKQQTFFIFLSGIVSLELLPKYCHTKRR